MATYSGLQTIAVWAGTFLLVGTLTVALLANRTVRKIGEAQVRAYLRIEDASIQVDEGGNNFNITLTVTNSGLSPAKSAAIVGDITEHLSDEWLRRFYTHPFMFPFPDIPASGTIGNTVRVTIQEELPDRDPFSIIVSMAFCSLDVFDNDATAYFCGEVARKGREPLDWREPHALRRTDVYMVSREIDESIREMTARWVERMEPKRRR